MRTRLSIATNGYAPSPVAQTTTRKTRGQSRPPGAEYDDLSAPGTISWKVTKRGPNRGGALSELNPGTASKRSEVRDGETTNRKRQALQADDSDDDTLLTDSDEVPAKQMTTVKGKGKGRASIQAAPTTATRPSRAIPAPSTSRARAPSATYSRKPPQASSVLTAPPESTSHTVQSASDRRSSVVPSTSSSATPLSRKAKGKARARRVSSPVTVLPQTVDDDEDEEMTMLMEEADFHILAGTGVTTSDVDRCLPADEDEMAAALEWESSAALSVAGVTPAGESGPSDLSDRPDDDPSAREELEDTDEGGDDSDDEMGESSMVDLGDSSMADETKILDKAPGMLPENTDGVEKQFANSEDSFESRPYPRRNLLPNFLSSKATTSNPFLAPPLPNHPAAQQQIQVQVHPPPQPESPAVGTKQLLLGRNDACVCGAERWGPGWSDEHPGGGEDEEWCDKVRELKERGWRIYREL